MKKYKRLLDVILLLGLSVITLLAVAPKTFVMPSSLQMLVLSVVLGLLTVFLVLFWREHPEDEREVQNQTFASRCAYSVGSLILIVALVLQSIQHDIDPAVPVALLAMIGTKIIVQTKKDSK